MDTAEQSLLAVVGLKLSTLIAGAVGSFISLRFFEGLKTGEKWTTFFGGWGLAAWLSSSITEFMGVKATLETGVALLVGLFGMSLTAALIKVIRETNWGELLAAILRRKGGGS